MSFRHSPKEEVLQNFTCMGQYPTGLCLKGRIVFQSPKAYSWSVNSEVRIVVIFFFLHMSICIQEYGVQYNKELNSAEFISLNIGICKHLRCPWVFYMTHSCVSIRTWDLSKSCIVSGHLIQMCRISQS